MSVLCKACGSENTAWLCGACWADLEEAFGQLPGLVNDLAAKVTRTSRPHREWRAAVMDEELAGIEEEYAWRVAALPVWKRSRDPRVTLPQTADVVDLVASELMDDARDTLTFWARHMTEARGAELVLWTSQPEGPVCAPHVHDFAPKKCGHWTNEQGEYTCARLHCSHSSCARIRNGELTGTAAALVRWFLKHRESVRFDELAGDIFADVMRLRERIAGAVDSSPSPTYMGPCRAEYDDTCCVRDLYRWPGTQEIECDGHRSDGLGCGAKHDPLDREQWLSDQLEDALVPLDTLRSFTTTVSSLRWPPAATIRSWRFRGRLDARGPDRFGAELFRGGDVLDLVRGWNEQHSDTREQRRDLQAG